MNEAISQAEVPNPFMLDSNLREAERAFEWIAHRQDADVAFDELSEMIQNVENQLQELKKMADNEVGESKLIAIENELSELKADYKKGREEMLKEDIEECRKRVKKVIANLAKKN